jgi:hypothetical protein
MKDERITYGPIIRAAPSPAATGGPEALSPAGSAWGPGAAVALEEPRPAEMAKNLAGAAARWIAAGLPVVSQAIYDERTAACGGCSYWDGKARLGLGKCKAPGCGCTGLKRWLSTETCPHPAGSRWPLDKALNK